MVACGVHESRGQMWSRLPPEQLEKSGHHACVAHEVVELFYIRKIEVTSVTKQTYPHGYMSPP